MAKKRYTKKKYGGQSEFEMGMASYVRHLLDYTDGGGNWIVDGLELPDGTQPSARWITNRIIHNFQKDSEGTLDFGTRFEYSPKAVSFLASILNQIKRYFNDENVDSEEVKGGIYDRDSFNKYVNDAIKILDNKIAELTPKISRASSNQFNILPVETLARPIKQQNVKVTMTPAVLTSMVNDKTRELQDKSQADNITISNLKSRIAEYDRIKAELEYKKAELERKEAEIDRKKKELKNSTNTSNTNVVSNPEVVKTEVVANPEVANPEVAVKLEVVSNPEVANPEVVANTNVVVNPEVVAKPEDANPEVVSNTEVAAKIDIDNTKKMTNAAKRKDKPKVAEQNPKISEEEKAKAEKEKAIALKRAEIIANLEKTKQQQQEKEFIEFLEKRQKKPKTRQEIIEELPNDLPDLTEGEIQKWGEKLNFYVKDKNNKVIKDEEGKQIVNKTCVNIFLNISRLSSDPDNIRFLEHLFSKKILNDDCNDTLKKFVTDLIIDKQNGLIDIAKTTEICVLNLWLTSIWSVKPELTGIVKIREAVDNDKITTFLDSIELIIKLFKDLLIFKKNNNEEIEPENDKNIYIIISQFLEKAIYNLMINRIGYSWGNFGAMFALDNINYAKFLRIIESYKKKTKYNLKSVNKFLTIISLFDGEQYKSFFKQSEKSIKAIEPIFDSIYEYFSNKTTPIPDIRVLGDIYSNFLQKSSEYNMFLILYAYKEKKEFPNMENIRKKILQIINEWETKMNEKEKVEHLAYITVCKPFGHVIQKLLDYSSIPDKIKDSLDDLADKIKVIIANPNELKDIIWFPQLQPPGGELPQPPGGGFTQTQPPGGGFTQTQPPGGGFTKTTGKNTKKGGRRRRTQKKRYRK
jgi:hypothetical protein